MKKILFVHNNFPAQFQHVARELARRPGLKLAAISSHTARAIPGVRLLRYTVGDGDVSATHPFARRFDLECRRAEQVLYAASNLVSSGFMPDLVLGHPGWGEILPLRSIFPKAHIVTYCELFYSSAGGDADFDSEFPQTGIDGNVRIQLKNAATLLALAECDCAISPTNWQKSTYPSEFQDKIQVIHDGIDVGVVKPIKSASFRLPSGRVLTEADEVLTFGTRSFEPLRGFHIFMRALPRIMAERKRAEVVIFGGIGPSYGLNPPEGRTWQSVFCDEVADRVDQARIHFVGQLPYADYLQLLGVSRAHVYLTYPFVLSWSLLEAMSAGCLVIASDTAPVREVLDGTNGLLVPFFDVEALAQRAVEALSRPARFKAIRQAARDTVTERYDLKRICLPRMLTFLGFDPKPEGKTAQDKKPVTEAATATKRVRDKPKSASTRRAEGGTGFR